MTEQHAPKTARPRPRARVNESTDGHLSGAEMRAAQHVADTRTVVAQWKDYRANTPIAAEVFLPPALCEALDALVAEAEEVGKP